MQSGISTYVRIKSCASPPEYGKNYLKLQDRVHQADAVVYGPDQEAFFQCIAGAMLKKCVQGYNCSIFAYGQTGSGKTYTIQGDEHEPGLVQRSLAYLHDLYPRLRLSFIEIYNESVFDLFGPENSISIREDPVDGVTVDGLCIAASSALEESLALYARGNQNRRTTATQMNDKSSRSHAVLTVYLENRDKSIAKRSRLCFVDLAGSEKCRESEAERVKETCNINRSLLCLGKIVHKLSSKDRWHVSYRDSKLTFLLKDSLGGNCKLAIIGNVNPEYPSETASTLQFLARSKMMTNNPLINYDTACSSVEELTDNLRRLDEENQVLKDELLELRSLKETSARESTLSVLTVLNTELRGLAGQLLDLKARASAHAAQHFESNRALLLKIDAEIANINGQRKENIQELSVSRKRHRASLGPARGDQ
ncbi:kinesin family member 15 [Pancytospora philotis]|nr:kinesin family member 15 [Pancytospora philotis]